jgi:hypothetical protein
MFAILDVLMCRERRHASIPRDQVARQQTAS